MRLNFRSQVWLWKAYYSPALVDDMLTDTSEMIRKLSNNEYIPTLDQMFLCICSCPLTNELHWAKWLRVWPFFLETYPYGHPHTVFEGITFISGR